MKGCVLFGRFVWADESKNRPGKKPASNGAGVPQPGASGHDEEESPPKRA